MAIQTKTMTVKSDTALAETTTTIRDTMTFDVSKMPNGITYKGLKAVLSFADPIQWNRASTYDSLTVVWDDATHASYASKRPVPQNIELTNEFYWFRTADLDAQVEIYRQEVKAFDKRISDNTLNITKSNEKIDALNNGINNIVYTVQGETAEAINNELRENTGKIIHFYRKEYNVASEIIIPSNSIIDFNNAVFNRVNGTHDIITIDHCNHIELYNLTIDGHSTDDNLDPSLSSDRFRGVNIVNSNDIAVSNVKVKNCCNAEIQTERNTGAIYIEDSHDLTFNFCDFSNNNKTGLFYFNSQNIIINGGTGKYNEGSAISGSNGTGIYVYNFISTNNGYTGISLNGDNLVAIGCTSNNCLYSGFDFGHNDTTQNNFICIGCTAMNNTYEGITMQYSSGIIDSCMIKNNKRSQFKTISNGNEHIKMNNCVITNENLTGNSVVDTNFSIGNSIFTGKAPVLTITLKGNCKINDTEINATAGSFGIGVESNAILSINNSNFNADESVTHNNAIVGSGDITFFNIKLNGKYSVLPSTINKSNFSGLGAKVHYVENKYFAVKLPFNMVFIQVIGSSEQLKEKLPDDFASIRNITNSYSNGSIAVNGTTLTSTISSNSASLIYFTNSLT